MEHNQALLRAIGILTQGKRWADASPEDIEAEIAESSPIAQLLSDFLPPIPIPPDAAPHEVLRAVSEALTPAVANLTGAFAFIYSELAQVHDAGRTDIKSADLLRDLALRYAANEPNDG
ncbi:hypothetical protein ACIBBB_04285 [Streptomyces sp. NPDC051217]|uniref:hypothetical protein n=1 Tax=Streptomyces sp. NPDC051217 TaxID=3365644 RepID=UPI0037B7B27E